MKRIVKFLIWTAIVLPLLMSGCGGGSGSQKVEVAELGLSMQIPSGWAVEKDNPRVFGKGNSTGLVMDEPLGGKSFNDRVEALIAKTPFESPKVISKTPLTVSGYDAIEAVIEYPNAGSKALKVYIHKDDRLIEISYVSPKEKFSEDEPSFRESIASIEIR